MNSLNLLAMSLVFAASCGSKGDTRANITDIGGRSSDGKVADIIETAEGAGSFSTLLAAIDVAELRATLKGDGPFTVFAPTDEAFDKIPEADLQALLADKAALTNVLTYHVVGQALSASDVLARTSISMLNGSDTAISLRDGAPFINDSKIVATDIGASNGVIHVIDTVLLPSSPAPELDIVETAQGAGVFTTLLAAVGVAELTATLKSEGPFTVFAPTDEAFAKIPAAQLEALLADKEALTAVLLYHVVAGKLVASDVLARESIDMVSGVQTQISLRDGAPFINDSKIVATDVLASNGVIHVIDTVLLPPAPATQPDIVETARAAGAFSTLLTALEVAGLTDVLKSDGPFTVFAPTDEAFAKIPAEALQALLADREALRNVLLYHVVGRDLKAADVLALESITMVNGSQTAISLCDGKALINDSVITATDISARNGTIHVIDTVLLP